MMVDSNRENCIKSSTAPRMALRKSHNLHGAQDLWCQSMKQNCLFFFSLSEFFLAKSPQGIEDLGLVEGFVAVSL